MKVVKDRIYDNFDNKQNLVFIIYLNLCLINHLLIYRVLFPITIVFLHYIIQFSRCNVKYTASNVIPQSKLNTFLSVPSTTIYLHFTLPALHSTCTSTYL